MKAKERDLWSRAILRAWDEVYVETYCDDEAFRDEAFRFFRMWFLSL